MQCVSHGNLQSSCFIQGLPTVYFQLFLTYFCQYFSKPIFYFLFRFKLHPIGLEKPPMLAGSLLSPSSNVLVYTHVSVGVFTRTSLSRPGGFNFFSGWMEHLWMDAWPYFPGLKVGQIHLYSSFLTVWWR